MELKVFQHIHVSLLEYLIKNPYNGIESVKPFSINILDTQGNPYNGIERTAGKQAYLTQKDKMGIHTMELKVRLMLPP